MANAQTPAPSVVYHVMVVSKRGREFNDADARDLLRATRSLIEQANGEATLSVAYGTNREDGTPLNPVIVLTLPRNTDPKKTQTNPSAFFGETDRVAITWQQITVAEDPQPLPAGAADLGKAVGGPTTVAADGGVVDTTVATNVGEGLKNAAG